MSESQATLDLESGDTLDVQHFDIHEAMSAGFTIAVIARGADDLDMASIKGKSATLTLLTGTSGKRTWSGVVERIAQTGVEPNAAADYELIVVPGTGPMKKRKNHRIFKHQSAPDIAKKILADWKIEPKMKVDEASHPKLEHRVQYGESDMAFLGRILHEAGIAYHFEQGEGGKSTMVLNDKPHEADPTRTDLPFLLTSNTAEAEDHVTAVSIHLELSAGKVTTRDHDFRRPNYKLGNTQTGSGVEAQIEEHHYAPGHANVLSSDAGGGTPVADKEGAYRHTDKETEARATKRLEALRAHATAITFATSVFDLTPGATFTMKGHPHPEVAGRKLLVVHSHINGTVNNRWHANGMALQADKPYRPLHAGGAHEAEEDAPQKPRIHGAQPAMVVGPQGEDIHTDEHGRVMVRFPWDREATDEQGSCWLRVNQPWAGSGHGMVAIPRVGQEVMVSFADGDPDHPHVTGRSFNVTAPSPYSLPEHKTRTSWRSSSGEGGNEITLEDKSSGEVLYIQAQRDLHKLVKHDEHEQTVGDRHVLVEGDLILEAKGNITLHAGKEILVKGGPQVKLNPGGAVPAAVKPRILPAGE